MKKIYACGAFGSDGGVARAERKLFSTSGAAPGHLLIATVCKSHVSDHCQFAQIQKAQDTRAVATIPAAAMSPMLYVPV